MHVSLFGRPRRVDVDCGSSAHAPHLLSRQVVGSVLWEASIRQMVADGIGKFEEVGTGRVLRGTLKRINRKLPSDGFGDQP